MRARVVVGSVVAVVAWAGAREEGARAAAEEERAVEATAAEASWAAEEAAEVSPLGLQEVRSAAKGAAEATGNARMSRSSS